MDRRFEEQHLRQLGRDLLLRPPQQERAQRLAEIEPRLGAVAGQGIWLPEVAQVRNPRLVRALRIRLRQLDVPLHSGEPVDQLLLDGTPLQSPPRFTPEDLPAT